MKSKTSFFNKGIFSNLTKRFWPLWAFYFIVMLLIMPVSLITNVYNTSAELVSDALACFCMMSTEGGTVTAFLLAIILAMAMFSFMYSRRTAGLISSLPVSREAVFASAYLAGLVPFVLINLAIAAIMLLIAGGRVVFSAALIWLGSITLQFIGFYGIALFTAMITGNLLALPILYVIFNFLAVSMEFIIRSMMSCLIFGFGDCNPQYGTPFSPAVWLFDELSFNVSNIKAPEIAFCGWNILIIFFIAGLVLTLIAFLLFKRRKMEHTGDVIAVEKLRGVFKYGVAVCAALSFGILLYDMFSSENVALLYVFCLLGAFMGYFVAEMLIRRSLKVFSGSWKGFIILAAACIIFLLSMQVDAFGIEKRIPEADDIEIAVIDCGQYSVTLGKEDYAALCQLHKSILSHKDKHQNFDSETDYYDYVRISYHLKNGYELKREYPINLSSCKEDGLMLEELLNKDYAVKDRTSLDIPVNSDTIGYSCLDYYDTESDEWCCIEFSRAEALDFYENGILPDIKAGAYGYASFVPGSKYEKEWLPADFSMDVLRGNENNDICDSLYIDINTDAVNTLNWILEHCKLDLLKLSDGIDAPEHA